VENIRRGRPRIWAEETAPNGHVTLHKGQGYGYQKIDELIAEDRRERVWLAVGDKVIAHCKTLSRALELRDKTLPHATVYRSVGENTVQQIPPRAAVSAPAPAPSKGQARKRKRSCKLRW
jgi:hypothetical protein